MSRSLSRLLSGPRLFARPPFPTTRADDEMATVEAAGATPTERE